MGIFKKKDSEIIDLTILQKKGILKEESATKTYNEDYIDIPQPETQSSDFLSSLAQAQTSNANPLGFMDSPQQTNEIKNSFLKTENKETQHIKVKLDDFEYKLDRFLERLENIESKFQNLEKKSE